MASELRGAAIAAAFTVIIFGVHIIASENLNTQGACVRTLPANIELPRELERTLERIYRSATRSART